MVAPGAQRGKLTPCRRASMDVLEHGRGSSTRNERICQMCAPDVARRARAQSFRAGRRTSLVATICPPSSRRR
eukprot:4409858-Prymnesium_polylepis.2